MKKYTEEDKEVVRLLLLEGLTAEQASKETDIPKGTINGWKTKWGIRHKNSYKDLYKGTVAEVKDRLIKLMQEAPEISYNYFNSAESSVPPATTYRKYFGSWEQALAEAGVLSTEKVSSIRPYSKPAKLYLVSFGEYYKIGITQQTVDQRLGGRYPEYSVIYVREFNDRGTAKELEVLTLNRFKHSKFVPLDFPAEGRGFTECFKATSQEIDELVKYIQNYEVSAA